MTGYDFGADFSAAFASGGSQADQTLLALLKEYLGIDLDDSSQDAELTQSLNISGDIVETYLDRVVSKRPVEEWFPHHFGSVVLHNMPVDPNGELSVTLDGVEQTDYSIWLGRGKLGHLSRQGMAQDVPMDWRSFAQVTVTYTAGFDPIPSDLAQAIIYTAADISKSQGTGNIPGGGGSGEIKSMSIVDVGSISYDVGTSASSSDGAFGSSGVIPSAAAQLLTRYKRMAA